MVVLTYIYAIFFTNIAYVAKFRMKEKQTVQQFRCLEVFHSSYNYHSNQSVMGRAQLQLL